MVNEIFTSILPLIGVLIGGVIGIGATFLTIRAADKREDKSRRLQFMNDQLTRFYSPLLALREEIHAKSGLRFVIENHGHEAWKELFENKSPEQKERLSKERREDFKKLFEYDQNQFRDEIIPAYEKMIDIFRENLWLAEPGTANHFHALIHFVEKWKRALASSIPSEVVEKLEASELNLMPLYDDLVFHTYFFQWALENQLVKFNKHLTREGREGMLRRIQENRTAKM